MPRRRITQDGTLELLADWRGSEQPLPEWGAENGLDGRSLRYWADHSPRPSASSSSPDPAEPPPNLSGSSSTARRVSRTSGKEFNMDKKLREFRAIVWTADPSVPGKRLIVWAETVSEAAQQLKERFGKDAKTSVWNEEDAGKRR